MQQLKAYLQLARPANIVTAVSDVWAGAAIAGFFTPFYLDGLNLRSLIYLSAATVGLYGGGVVFNDVFDAELDKTERPERPIPAGRAGVRGAAVWGAFLLLAGIAAAYRVNWISGLLAVAIAIAALVYDKFTKPHPLRGPLNMGICRGLNLLLGMSILFPAIARWWFLAVVPVIYIAAITMISRGEVHGGKKPVLSFAAFLYAVVIVIIFIFSCLNARIIFTLPFLFFFAFLIFRPLGDALKDPAPGKIGRSVKAGVIALVVMNAAWAAAFASWQIALIILVLLPVSLLLAKIFAVT